MALWLPAATVLATESLNAFANEVSVGPFRIWRPIYATINRAANFGHCLGGYLLLATDTKGDDKWFR